LSDPKAALHPDLQGKDSEGCQILVIGTVPLGLGIFLGWLDWGISKRVWSDLTVNSVAMKSGFWDYLLEPLVPLVIFLLALAFVVVGGFFIAGYVTFLFSDMDDKERLWREKATSVDATETARPGSIKLTKSTTGMAGKGHAGPSFTFGCDLVSLEGREDVGAFKYLCVERSAEFGPGAGSFRLSELPKKDALINRLISLSIGKGLPTESLENRPGKHVSAVTIPASVKVDPGLPPRVLIAEAEGIRIWCSVSTEEEIQKLPKA
jgi:hypothetical protein